MSNINKSSVLDTQRHHIDILCAKPVQYAEYSNERELEAVRMCH